jgi:hypothetical protein
MNGITIAIIAKILLILPKILLAKEESMNIF